MEQNRLPWQQRLLVEVIGVIGFIVLRLLIASLRWRYVYLTKEAQTWERLNPLVFSFWHNRQLIASLSYIEARRRFPQIARMSVLISQHFDGRVIARIMDYFGIGTVAGSSSRGGNKALGQMLDLLEKGEGVAITPDGPRGPIYRAKPGVLALAVQRHVPIVFSAFAAERYWAVNSWDKMIIPKPFSRAVCVIGGPLSTPNLLSDAQFSEWLKKVEGELNAVTKIADTYNYSAKI